MDTTPAFQSIKLEQCLDRVVDNRGKTPPLSESGIELLEVNSITDGSKSPVYENVRKYISQETYATWFRSGHPQKGDTLISTVGAIGRVAFVGQERGCIAQNVVALRPRPGVLNSEYLYYYLTLNDTQNRMLSLNIGVAQPSLRLPHLLALEVALPSLPIQRRIVGILSAYDELIENNQRRIKILETMARNLYREWFVHFRFPGHENCKIVSSPLGMIPEGWEVKKLGEVADTFRGRSYRSMDLADIGGLPFLNLKCLDRDGGFRRSGLKRYTGDFKEAHIAKKGDIVMAITDMTQERRIVARAALVPSLDSEFGVFSMDLIRIESKRTFSKVFLYAFLRYSSFADEVKQHANGANVLHLSPDRITAYQFPMPPIDLMHRFAIIVAPMIEKSDTLGNTIDTLRRTRDLLLPRLMSGQLDLESLAS